MSAQEQGIQGNSAEIAFTHDHYTDTEGNVMSRKDCPICSDPEVLAMLAAYRQRLKERVEGLRRESSEADSDKEWAMKFAINTTLDAVLKQIAEEEHETL